MKKFKFKYVADNGETAEFIPHQINWLGYSELEKAVAGERCRLEFHVAPEKFIMNGAVLDDEGTVKFEVAFRHGQQLYAIGDEGWLPFPFLPKSTLLVDRNVVDAIHKIMNGRGGEVFDALNWWFDLHGGVQIKINPVLYAFEGACGRMPSFNEFCTDYLNAVTVIEKQLPSFELVKYQEIHFKAAYDILLERKNKFEIESKFLQNTAPLVVSRHAQHHLSEIEDQIDNISNDYGLLNNSLAHILVKSCLYENKDGAGLLAARNILKPKQTYTREMAYNALSDLFCIEIYLNSKIINLNETFFFCTRDWALAAFFLLLAPKFKHSANGKIHVDISLDSILPRKYNTER